MELCDWESLVPRDATVVVKPNLCTTVPGKIEMSNTAADLTRAVCEVLLTRTRRVILGESDNLRQKAQEAFEATGYVPMAKKLGVRIVNFSEDSWARVEDSPIGGLELPKTLLEADVFITLPVLKTHALTYFTGALKNQWGCLPQYNRILHHKNLDEALVYLQRRLRPALTLMDGIVGMEGRGPVNGKPRRLDLILASRDAVALDATAMRLVGLDTSLCRHLTLAGKEGLGVTDENRITVDGDWAAHSTQYEPPVLDRAVAAMNYMSRYPWFVKFALEKDTIFYPVRAVVQALRKTGIVAGGA
jgi:uncharacterized protein (DUF362 family)